ncbi:MULTISPECIES: ATP-binding protein [unclassified Janthinobacterium]|uniref:hybrid sensor histidine kinase/response regulator n=1 Tax=unclassified Janthinobacterium TaxID=2610881 RepID=UPI0017B88C68|nr:MULTISPECIES: ATP-binding protein [unclassified Janthinobacterium]MBB5609372.1 PAS domain S-box-containing protein [Janthinobacterium sp. S3T4]MBB5614545.1 PAS domain S-box-containing protein [Janthinobacterium sp. S3M3]
MMRDAMPSLPNADSLFQHAACGLLLCATDGTILKVNATFCGWLGYTAIDLLGKKKLQELLTIGGRIFHQTHWTPLMQVQGMASEVLLDMRQRQGQSVPMLFNAVRREHGGVFYDEIAVFVATDRRKYEQQLQLARSKAHALNEELAVADRRKDEFLATLAHELRNPLAPMRNVLEVLKLAQLEDPKLSWARDVLGRQLCHMTHLVDDLMEVSRITRGRLELRRHSVELAPVVEAALHSVATLVAESGHRLHVEQWPSAIWLDADATRLGQMIANLLTNAAKYTPSQGAIWLTVGRSGNDVLITVRDSGIGIAPEHLARVFDMFSQLEPALSRSQGGLGIGLSLVRGLAELHGGSVSAHSDGVGQGSTFTLRLPLPATPLPAPAPAATSRQLQAGSRDGKVLVIDDSADAAESLALALDILGYDMRTAYDGAAGIALAESFQPQVILLDIGLPRMNGYEVARHLRSQPYGRNVILVAVTGWGQDKDRKMASDAGFDLHLTKPVDFYELDTVLQKMLKAV